jgi:AraC-like DNA-binding protein
MNLVRHNCQWRILRSGRMFEICLETLAFEEGYRVGAVCDRLEMSEAYFREVCIRDLGLTPKEWMRNERMVVARRMLVGGTDPKKIAKLLGFADMNSFRREFRAIYGVSMVDLPRLRARDGVCD